MGDAKNKNSRKAANLRQKAEEVVRKKSIKSPVNLKSMTTEETLEMVQELQVHQIELEIQNEELRITQLELEQARERYFDLYDNAPVGYCTISEKGVILEANFTGAELLDISKSELINKRLSDFILPEDQDAFFLIIKKFFKNYESDPDPVEEKRFSPERIIRGKKEPGGELRMLKKDRAILWVNLTGMIVKSDDNKLICRISMNDITERKFHENELSLIRDQAEKSLNELKLKYQSIVEDQTELICRYSPDGKVTFANKAYAWYYGKTQEEVIGKNFISEIPKADIEMITERLASITSDNPVASFEHQVMAPGMGFRWQHWTHQGIYNLNGKLIEYQAVGRDITEKKRLEEQNIQVQKAESLNRMAGAIAHHFNNQLQVVLGYLELVIGKLPPEDYMAEQLSIAMEAAGKASEVSTLMLTYLGQKADQPATIYLSEFCQMSLPVIQEVIPEGVILETDFPLSGPYINADLKQIQRLITNLVTNACESMKTGTVHISVRTYPAADIPVSHRHPIEWKAEEDYYACLELKDTGSGIHKEDMKKLFDPFFSTRFTGRGLGLSVVLGIVKAHGGVITVNSRNKGGTVFRVFFPLATKAESEKSEEILKTFEPDSDWTVLLVEDEKAVREITALILKKMGLAVIQAKDGIEALEIFKKHKDKISCLVSDLTMPQMDGWETISALRAISPDLPVVLASGYNEASVMAGEHAELPDFFLNKPYTMDNLTDKIGHAIARKAIDRSKKRIRNK